MGLICHSRSPNMEISETVRCHWDPDQKTISVQSTPASGSSLKTKRCIVDGPNNYTDSNSVTSWDLKDLSMAGKLLRKPSIRCNFSDEHEMRRVFAMIYDVYRCKCKLFISKRIQINVNEFTNLQMQVLLKWKNMSSPSKYWKTYTFNRLFLLIHFKNKTEKNPGHKMSLTDTEAFYNIPYTSC